MSHHSPGAARSKCEGDAGSVVFFRREQAQAGARRKSHLPARETPGIGPRGTTDNQVYVRSRHDVADMTPVTAASGPRLPAIPPASFRFRRIELDPQPGMSGGVPVFPLQRGVMLAIPLERTGKVLLKAAVRLKESFMKESNVSLHSVASAHQTSMTPRRCARLARGKPPAA